MASRINFNKSVNISQNEANQYAQEVSKREVSTFTGSSNDPFNAPKRDNYQTYPYDYFAGSDCKIFFGDIWVDDVITIQYNVSQNKVPIYGYASQLFDTIAKGQIIVQGSLSISFKETGYLNLIQGIIDTQKRDVSSLIQNKIDQTHSKAETGKIKFDPRLNYIGNDSKPSSYGYSFSPNGTPQIIRQQETIEQILTNKKVGTSLSKTLLGDGHDSDRDFEDFAEILEDTIWGDSNGNPLALEHKLKRVDEFDYSSNGGIISAKKYNYANVLNIMLTFGDINDYRAEHTLVVLNDVHFVSTGMIVSPTGEPIAETYTFIARDINDSISSEIKTNINPIKLNVGNDNIKISKLEDISSVEQFLNKNKNSSLKIKLLASFDQDGWTSSTGELELNFYPNNVAPFVDQLCNVVEKAMNEIRVPEVIDSNKTQYIIKIELGDSSFEEVLNDLTMIVDQVVPLTRSYKVISPTRTGFAATSIITRDDFYSNLESLKKSDSSITANDEKSKKDISINAAEKNKKESQENLGSNSTSQQEQSKSKYNLPEFMPNKDKEKLLNFTSNLEGYRNTAYKDTEGKQTIGYGFNISPQNEKYNINTIKQALNVSDSAAKVKLNYWQSGGKIEESEAKAILNTGLVTAENDIKSLVGDYEFSQLTPGTQRALTDATYQYGKPKMATFKETIKYAQVGDIEGIIRELADSQGSRQTPERNYAREIEIRGQENIKRLEKELAEEKKKNASYKTDILITNKDMNAKLTQQGTFIEFNKFMEQKK